MRKEIPSSSKDDGLLVQSMLDETRLFFTDLLWNDKSLLNLISSDFTYLNRRLADYYQLPRITEPPRPRAFGEKGADGMRKHSEIIRDRLFIQNKP